MGDLLTTVEVGRILGVHQYTAGRFIDAGALKGFRTAGGHRRVAASDLRRYLVEQSMAIPAELGDGLADLRLLAIDGEQRALDALKEAFAPFSSDVVLTLTASWVEGLLVLAGVRPAGVLVDLEMPGVDGLELLRRLTAFAPLKGTKAIAMTSRFRPDIVASALAAGAVACLEKPINAAQVLGLLKQGAAEPRPDGGRHSPPGAGLSVSQSGMSFDQQLRAMIQEEIRGAISPLANAIQELQQVGDVASQLRSLLGQGPKRGPGRPPKVAADVSATTGAKRGRKPGRPVVEGHGCAVIGCKRPARSKGYCSAHYQKRRMLERTRRLPSDWVENAAPQSAKDLVLSRGRRAGKLVASN